LREGDTQLETTGTISSSMGGGDAAVMDTVCDVIAEIFGVPRSQVGAETTRDDIPEWDSVGHLNLMLALEEAFDVSFSVDEMPELVSAAAIAGKVREKCPLP
jgi:acyl carrier protein